MGEDSSGASVDGHAATAFGGGVAPSWATNSAQPETDQTGSGAGGPGGDWRARATAAGMLASLAAATCVTTVTPLLGVDPGGVSGVLVSQFGGVSGNLLAECITRNWDRWRGKDDPVTRAELRETLTDALREALNDETRARPVRANLAVWARRIGTARAAITTADGDDTFRQQFIPRVGHSSVTTVQRVRRVRLGSIEQRIAHLHGEEGEPEPGGKRHEPQPSASR